MPDTTMTHYNAADVTLETSPTTGSLDEALAKAQGEIDIASKDSVNPAFKSKYANLTSVWEACRPALAKNSIALTQWPLASADNRLHIITRIAHKGEWMQARFSIPVDKANAHGVGSAITYAKRFTLSAVLGIVADDDDDGNAASKRPPGGGQGDALAKAKAEIAEQTGNSRSTYDLTKEKKALDLVKDSAKLAIGMCQSRAELKGWIKDNKAELAEKLSTADYDAVIDMVDARWDELPEPEKVA